MQTVTTHVNRAPHALVQVGQFQITVELPGPVTVGDPDWTAAAGKAIAAGLEDAFSTWPPKAAA